MSHPKATKPVQNPSTQKQPTPAKAPSAPQTGKGPEIKKASTPSKGPSKSGGGC